MSITNLLYSRIYKKANILDAQLTAVIIALLLSACGGGASREAPTTEMKASVKLLQQDLWSDRDAYDASHALMVPMHYAFLKKSKQDIEAYADFFQRLRADDSAFVSNKQSRLQFLYLYTRFINMLASEELCTQRIFDLYGFANSHWLNIVNASAWQWSKPAFLNFFDRMDWKLSTTETNKSYYRGLIDEEMFSLAIGADLLATAKLCSFKVGDELVRANSLVDRIYTSELTLTDVGGWLFQQGVWRDHPDYLYAGNSRLSENLKTSPVFNISTNTSHSMRQPLFLLSFACARDPGEGRDIYLSLMHGLSLQLTAKVISLPTSNFRGVTMTNFMNGENGVYRYGYSTQGVGNGYGPFELSGSFNRGWWSFLGNAMSPYYEQQWLNFPFDSAVVEKYVGPNTTRERNPAFVLPEYYSGDLALEILMDSVAISNHEVRCND